MRYFFACCLLNSFGSLTSSTLQLLAVASSVVSGVDMGYAGSNGLEPQQFVSNNQPCGYICYGFGEFDGQGSGHDFSGNVISPPTVLASALFDTSCT